MIEVDLGTSALVLLLVAGALSGAGSVLIFRRLSDPANVKIQIRAMVAHLMEFRLFADSPRLILRAQREILIANASLLRAMALPLLVLGLISTFLFEAGEAIFTRAPLRVGEPAIVTAHLSNNLLDARLDLPDWIKLEAEPVRVLQTSEVSWRIRPMLAGRGTLKLQPQHRVVERFVFAGNGLHWIDGHPGSGVNSISVQYPPTNVLGHHWLSVFSTAAMAGAFLGRFEWFKRGGLSR